MDGERLKRYLHDSIPENEKWVTELEAYAQENHVPIMDAVSMHFVQQLIRIQQSKHILEIGTAIGYSALRMLQANPDASIVTMERDEDRYKFAMDVIKEQNKQQQIEVLYGDALDLATDMNGRAPFDLLFIDAAKGQYQRFFELYRSSIQKGGLIITDNVLFKGYVASPSEDNPRYTKIASKINNYNQWLINHPDFHTSIVPIGDGVAISIKK